MIRLKRHLILRKRRETGQSDLFKARLGQIIEMSHPRVRLAQKIDWGILAQSSEPPTRTVPAVRPC